MSAGVLTVTFDCKEELLKIRRLLNTREQARYEWQAFTVLHIELISVKDCGVGLGFILFEAAII